MTAASLTDPGISLMVIFEPFLSCLRHLNVSNELFVIPVAVFHTFFGIAGLSLLGWFEESSAFSSFVSVDPVYALPMGVVDELGLTCQRF